jgi:hypothetical protein
MLYAGKTLAEIAGMDDLQMRWVVSRRRDQQGRLIRRDRELPEWVEVDAEGMRIITQPRRFGDVFRRTYEELGLSQQQIEARWTGFWNENLGEAPPPAPLPPAE